MIITLKTREVNKVLVHITLKTLLLATFVWV